jgi:hypothetical protein
VPSVLEQTAETLALQSRAIKDFYLSQLESEFLGLQWWGADSIPIWKSKSVPLVREAQLLTADLANTFIDLQFQEMFGDDYDTSYPSYDLVTGPAIRNGVSIDDVYSRTFKPVWEGIGAGQTEDEAVRHGLSRLESMFSLDIERVIDHTAIERFANDNRIIGHRRVLNGSHNCALCILASTQLYHKKSLKPIHPRCKCKVLPVLPSDDVDAVLSKELVDQVHASIKDRFGISDPSGRQIDYRHLVLVRNHGEYGPVLTLREYNFTGPSALKTPGE